MLVIYDKFTDKNFLITHLFPWYKINSSIRENNFSILNQIIDNTKYFIFHINMSNTKNYFSNKEELLNQLSDSNIKSINSNLSDITKRHIQKQCIDLNINNVVCNIKDTDNVIIKSNYNFNNINEYRLSKQEKNLLSISLDIIPFKYIITTKNKICEYDINLKNDSIIIEKFVENDQDLFYRVYKLFSRLVISEVRDKKRIKKMPIGIHRKNYFVDLTENNAGHKFESIIDQINKLSLSMNIDFAAFDIVMSNDHEFYIIDVNNTPHWGTLKIDDYEMMEYLKLGII